jgi:hypothetical protein
MSIHPVMTDAEVRYIVDALEQLAQHHESWSQDYVYTVQTNEFHHRSNLNVEADLVESWYSQFGN